MNVLIIDDFFDSPKDIEELAQDQQYNCSQDVHSGWQGYRSLRLYYPELDAKILTAMKNHFDCADYKVESYFHVLPTEVIDWDTEYQHNKYHADPVPYAGVVYLSSAPEHCGTSIVNGEKNQIVSYPHQYNRLVAYPGHYVHAASFPYGSDIQTGRLTYNFFLSNSFYGF